MVDFSCLAFFFTLVVCSLFFFEYAITMSSPRSNDASFHPESWTAHSLGQQTVATLHLLCDQRKLPATGRKPAIIARLLASRATSTPSTEPQQPQRATDPTLLTATNVSGDQPVDLQNILTQLSALQAQVARLQPSEPTTISQPTVPGPIERSQPPPSSEVAPQASEQPFQWPSPPSSSGTQPVSANTPPVVNLVGTAEPPLPGSSALPTVPERLRDRILWGEYIDFTELLPDNLDCQERSTLLCDSDAFRIISARNPRRPIADFSAWLEAWTICSSVIAKENPSRAAELLGYQFIISNAQQQFTTESVFNDDKAFRHFAAAHPSTRWDTIHTTLWTLKMLRGVRPSCPSCTIQHSRDRCPFTPRPFRSSTVATAGRDEAPVCRNFNRGRPCLNTPCRYRHACWTCGASHPGSQCGSTKRPRRPNTAASK